MNINSKNIACRLQDKIDLARELEDLEAYRMFCDGLPPSWKRDYRKYRDNYVRNDDDADRIPNKFYQITTI